jgi:antitoxin component HigA of HigAB toxin-antitoxin module
MSTTLADPVEMIRRGAPRLIRSREEFAEYTRALLSLTAKPKPTAAEQDAINLLTLLIGQYETALRPAPKGVAVEVLRQLMKRNGLSQTALTPEFGCSTVASQVLRGDRQFTRSHIARLSKRFNVSPAAFFDESSGVPLTRDMGENAKVKRVGTSTKKAARALTKKGGAR